MGCLQIPELNVDNDNNITELFSSTSDHKEIPIVVSSEWLECEDLF